MCTVYVGAAAIARPCCFHNANQFLVCVVNDSHPPKHVSSLFWSPHKLAYCTALASGWAERGARLPPTQKPHDYSRANIPAAKRIPHPPSPNLLSGYQQVILPRLHSPRWPRERPSIFRLSVGRAKISGWLTRYSFAVGGGRRASWSPGKTPTRRLENRTKRKRGHRKKVYYNVDDKTKKKAATRLNSCRAA